MKRRHHLHWTLAAVAALAFGPAAHAQTYYTTRILNDTPVLYWSFDEADGNAQQLAPLSPWPPVTTENDLVSVAGADRVNQVDAGGYAKLGRAANFNGNNYFQAPALRAAQANLAAPWAVEFWMQVVGANTDNRQDYLINFGNGTPGSDNAPAFIYDFEPDTLEVFGGAAGRTGSSPPINDNNWHHVVWVFYGDGTVGVADRCDLWVDDVNFGNVRDNFSRSIKLSERLLVGAATASPDNGFEGRLDELAVYDLSAYVDEAGVSAKVAQLVSDHYLEATTETGNTYADAVLADTPLLYWNFDEESGNALQKAPITLPLPNNAQNQLLPMLGATRAAHSAIGSGFELGNTLDLNGTDFFEAADLDAGTASVAAPWAVEFWMQVQGANAGNRADYLLNFGVGADNSPAFIYDYKPDQLEIYAGAPRTDNGPIISDNNWHHVMWVFYGDGTVGVGNRVEAFVDGINLGRDVRATFTRSLKVSDRLLVGAAVTDGTGGFEGRLDEVAIYHLSGLADEAAVRTKVTLMESNHYLAAFGPPGNAAITITQEPSDATAQKGGTATFTVAATVSGAPADSLTYQWLRNGSPVAGATGASYTTPVLSLGDLGTSTYAVRISTLGGVFVLSRDAILTVPVPPYQATYYANQVLSDQPLLYWNFDENSGNALQRASLGAPPPVTTENDLVPVAGATRVDSTGKLGRAASLNGANYYQAAALRAGKTALAAPWAFEFWMKVEGDNSGNRQDYLFNFGNAGADNAPAFIYDFEADTLEVFGGAAGRSLNSPPINDNNWHHVVWAFYGDGSVGVADRCDLWVDGADFGNVRGSFSRTLKLNENLLVGAALAGGVNAFEGALDEVAIYDLSGLADAAAVTAKAESLASHYATAFSADLQPYAEVILAEQPVLYWNFDEADGNALQIAPVKADSSANDLVPVFGAGRVEHSASGSSLFLGNAANLSGGNFFQAAALKLDRASLNPPWVVEFWMQVQGANTIGVGDRQDYLLNFGNAGADNRPSFIFDYEPDTLEAIGDGRTSTSPAIVDDNWHHVVWAFYGNGAAGVASRMDLWVDGANFGDVRDSYSRAIKVNERLLVGAAVADATGGFEGRLDELALYDLSALSTEADVAARVQDMVTRHYGAAQNPPPAITWVRSGNQLILSWSRAGFVLQGNDNVADPGAWIDVPEGATSPVTITLPASGNQFYRLKQQ